MNEFLVAWTVCATVGCFVVLAVVVGLEVRDHHRATRQTEPIPVPVPRIPEQRQPVAAAAIVRVTDPAAFDEFLRELILTPHVETALS